MTSYYAGLDVGDTETAVCVTDAAATVLFEGRLRSDAKTVASCLRPYKKMLQGVGIETGATASRLYKQLWRQRYPMICLDAFHAHSALRAQRNKTDRADAKGLALLLCRGMYREAHVKSDEALAVRFLLNARATLVRRSLDIRLTILSAAKLFGFTTDLKGKRVQRIQWSRRARSATASDAANALLRSEHMLAAEVKAIDAMLAKMARSDPVCRRLMTMPGVGVLTALTFKAAIDDPARFQSSRTVGAHFGLTTRRHQSGAIDIGGRISKRGDSRVRQALYLAAAAMLAKSKKESRLRNWGLALRERHGFRFAAVACARRMAVILHRMWVTETDFDPAR
ncbi:MAG TPA: IS110 family transposase [Vitreimonas sp.]|uniref:IS110 family transposase n=1 Tax=Vitreimonas sp. TaxID=3069702 RepID=UPI002D75D003|nr:IS110 family transposase [Vitreimonas sp.]HYD86773.1 IS110 family transposase [Vitreimonas sp.]